MVRPSSFAAPIAPIANWLLIATLCVVQFVDVLGTTVVIVALPAIQADLGLGEGAREQVAAIYALLFGALLLLAGRLADAWGARRLFVAGLITFGVGSAVGGPATIATIMTVIPSRLRRARMQVPLL